MKLIAFFSLDAALLPDGRVGLTRKIVEGLARMALRWPGELVAVFAPRRAADTNLDPAAFGPAELPFTVVVGAPEGAALARLVAGAALVQIGVDHRHVRVARACREAGVPFVVVAEYALRTRLQIAAAEARGALHLARRATWEVAQELQQRRVMRAAAGLQCNGTPAFEAWAPLSPRPLLFFDSRVDEALLASADHVDQRGRHDVLSVAFSGRLVPMKGVLHLPEVARHLRARGVRFRLRVFGGGPLEAALRQRVSALGLEREVTLEGIVPFAELMQTIAADTDLFVCPHVQGDPSCTYLETLACGVPIAGFDNDAWRGLRARTGAGYGARCGDAAALADAIVEADRDRGGLKVRARRALAFARGHTFEATFARRMEHLREVVVAPRAPRRRMTSQGARRASHGRGQRGRIRPSAHRR